MKNTLYPIVARRLLTEDNLLLEVQAPDIAEAAKVGQFVNILGKKFLRRPFGIARVNKETGTIQVGIKVKSCGTRDFFDYKIGDELDILGPLGTGFNLDGLDSVYIIGGGTGIYPLLFLADVCQEKNIVAYVACGFRTEHDALLLDEFLAVATDFAWANEDAKAVPEKYAAQMVAGYAQLALEKLYAKHGKKSNTAVLTCGPLRMMQTAADWAKDKDLSAQVSMEERMACGFGICRTCAVELNETAAGGKNLNYARCCIEGPVFPAEVIAWPMS